MDIVIPTWNSMPHFERCLNSLDDAFPRLDDIIVVDKQSTDGTREEAEKYGCRVITNTGTLGHARWDGLNEIDSKWLAFIDSDIELPRNWYNNMKGYMSDDVGWIFGRTIPDDPVFQDFKLRKMNKELKEPRVLKHGQRAFTNNTLCRREPLLEVDKDRLLALNAFEDNLLSMTMQEQEYKVLEVPVPCTHIGRHSGVWRFGWNTSGYIHLHGRDVSCLLDGLYPVKHGIEMVTQYGDFRLLREGMRGVMIHLLTFVFPSLFYEVER